jgi:hypothetical protein
VNNIAVNARPMVDARALKCCFIAISLVSRSPVRRQLHAPPKGGAAGREPNSIKDGPLGMTPPSSDNTQATHRPLVECDIYSASGELAAW